MLYCRNISYQNKFFVQPTLQFYGVRRKYCFVDELFIFSSQLSYPPRLTVIFSNIKTTRDFLFDYFPPLSGKTPPLCLLSFPSFLTLINISLIGCKTWSQHSVILSQSLTLSYFDILWQTRRFYGDQVRSGRTRVGSVKGRNNVIILTPHASHLPTSASSRACWQMW